MLGGGFQVSGEGSQPRGSGPGEVRCPTREAGSRQEKARGGADRHSPAWHSPVSAIDGIELRDEEEQVRGSTTTSYRAGRAHSPILSAISGEGVTSTGGREKPLTPKMDPRHACLLNLATSSFLLSFQ